ncbi:transglutaminase domain-containing protein [Aequorivita echinoideorum]|uniref:DUF3857 domain-containing protein n=1 Tax=Aequorivita echinoideorum TaxID=1549647 RepID=A0ABS5S469_9FLAO|nr:transglutaminase domain-containing protein [Aequorivita echinoideorum]MBT0608014.1 DUF3857 domain-containing protein [Aequorivita echinoideorum]
MNSIFSLLGKKPAILLVFLCFSLNLFSQNSAEVWDLLLQNKRKEALEKVNSKKFVNSIDNLILKNIVKNDNGIFATDPNFVQEFIAYPDFENYMYAYWGRPFLFDEYYEQGFSAKNMAVLKAFDDVELKNSTVYNAFHYLRGISYRTFGNWEMYEKETSKINSIAIWEHCGLFENLNNSGLSIVYGPEENAANTAEFDARSIGSVSWYKPNLKEESGYQFFTNHIEYGSGVNYAQTFIQSPTAQRVQFKLGKAGLVRVWLNDVLIFENEKDVITEMDAYVIAANLQQGANRLLVKVASEDNTPYIMMRVEDENDAKIDNLEYSLSKRNYTKATEALVNAEVYDNSIIRYFIKRKESSKVNFQDDLNLFMAYMRISDYEKGKELIAPWLEKYPASSFLKQCLITCSIFENNDIRQTELIKNMEVSDPDYYLSLIYKLKNKGELMNQDLETFEKTFNKMKNATDISYIKNTADIMVQLRKNQLDSVRINLRALLDNPNTPSALHSVYANFFTSVLQDEPAAIAEYEKIVTKYLDYQAVSQLSYFYQKQNRQEESLAALKSVLDHSPGDNNVIYDYVERLHDFNRHEESLPYINKGLENFPFSTVFMRLKGDAYLKMNNKKEALANYEKALIRNSGNKALRKKINDLKNIKDPLEKFRDKDFYSYLEKNRNKIADNNYGVNTLLDEINVMVYENGGGRYRGTYIYEVTSSKGVEELKEYNLQLGGDYTILKSEIVKPNKAIVPAERSGYNLVFNELAPGDVVYVDFESTFSSGGRFYQDFIDTQSFDSYYPVVRKTYRVITPKSDIQYKITNGNVAFKKSKMDEFNVFEWNLENTPGIPLYEDYMPPFVDVSRNLNISTIDSWSDISNWYSDLVRSQIIYDAEVKKAFNSIFPNGYKNLTEDERARKIYEYVTGDFTYSYVSFKQSGFVPQKPSKTIKTKLGDCKDFSTLYVTLAREAEIDAQLVLILTSDFGKDALVLPSTDFNHCIAKVTIDGNEQYLELTDKYLPYKSLPTSLENALALEIPYSSNATNNSSLFILNDVARNENGVTTNTTIEVGEESSKIELVTTTSGYLSSFYHSMTDESNETVLKEEIYNQLLTRTDSDITLNSFKIPSAKGKSNEFTLETQLTLNERVNPIGSFKTFKLPYFSNPYTSNIVNLDNRNYTIDYKQYENADFYEENYVVKIPEGTVFIEIPENKEFTFEDHSYNVVYNKLNENELAIKIKSKPGKKNIVPEKYPEFKKFVKNVLDTRKQFFAYK